MFGIRVSIGAIARGDVSSAPALSAFLLEQSGIGAVRDAFDSRFRSRARQLKAAAALRRLRELASTTRDDGSLSRVLDELELSSNEIALLGVLHQVLSGVVDFDAAEENEVVALLNGATAAARAGLPGGTPPDATARAAIEAVARWRERSADAFANRATALAAEAVARAYEAVYADLRGHS
jgi:hypothetical protein